MQKFCYFIGGSIFGTIYTGVIANVYINRKYTRLFDKNISKR